jgi:mono/diheme cytochrome c family protein
MKFRNAIIPVLIFILSACNFTLAEDVTPPPGYIPPTPAPTLSLIPAQTPNIENGAAIYVEKCAPCHGETGLGDGPQGIQLQGVTVPAFALPEIARPKSPAQWYTVVTRGNIQRFMPPFASLTDQERWDVVAYVMTLNTTQEEIQKGKALFEANCPNCSTDFFKDQSKMSALSTVELARIVRLGNQEFKAFGENLSDEEMWAVASYLRTLSFDTTLLAQATVASAIATPVAADAGTPSAETTPLEGTAQAEVPFESTPVAREGYGNVSGSIENRTGKSLPSNMAITLRGFDHDMQNPNAGPQEVLTLNGSLASDGTFVFEDIEVPENRIFVAEVLFEGVTMTSGFTVVESGQTAISLQPLVLYPVTEDTSMLSIDQLHIFFETTAETTYDVLALYTFRNSSETIISVPMGNQQEIPFLKFPTNAQGLGYEAVQDSAPFLSIDQGFAMAPSEQPYGILAFSSVTKEKETSVTQPLVLPVTAVRIFVPDGMKIKSDQLTQDSQQDIQGTIYQSYVADNLKAGEALTFTVSGSPKASATPDQGTSPNSTLLIGAGGLGIALILAGAWMYLRDRKRVEEEDEEGEENEFESSEDVMDAIITLDDLHRAKKISDEAYQKRRAELKEMLKEMV